MGLHHGGNAPPDTPQATGQKVGGVRVERKGVFGTRDDGDHFIGVGTQDDLADDLARPEGTERLRRVVVVIHIDRPEGSEITGGDEPHDFLLGFLDGLEFRLVLIVSLEIEANKADASDEGLHVEPRVAQDVALADFDKASERGQEMP